MSAAGIPQIAVVMGSCTAGGAYVPAMCDESIIVKEPGHDLPRRPAAGEGGDRRGRHARRSWAAPTCTRGISGVADHFALERSARAGDRAPHRRAISTASSTSRWSCASRAQPRYDPSEIYGVIPTDTRKPYDVREVIARIVDGSEFDEFKARYGTTLVTGFAHICGLSGRHRRQQRHPVLRVGAEGRALHRAVRQRKHPAGVPAEHHRLHGRARSTRRAASPSDGAKMVTAVACAQVPKFTVIIGGSFGAGNYGMCGRAFGRASCGCGRTRASRVMGGEQAASVLATVKRDGIEAKGGKLERGGRRGVQGADPRAVRARRAIRTTPARGCGTTASSIRPTRGACSGWRMSAALTRRSSRRRVRRVPDVDGMAIRGPTSMLRHLRDPEHIVLRDRSRASSRRSRAACAGVGGGRAATPREVLRQMGAARLARPHGAGRVRRRRRRRADQPRLRRGAVALDLRRLHHHRAGAHRHGVAASGPRGHAKSRSAVAAGHRPRRAITAVAITEPDAGSDVAGIRTRADARRRRMGAQRRKMFITNGVHADLYFVAARTDAGREGLARHVDVHRREGHAGLPRRARAEEDRLAVVGHGRAGVRRLPRCRRTICSAKRTTASTRSCGTSRPSASRSAAWQSATADGARPDLEHVSTRQAFGGDAVGQAGDPATAGDARGEDRGGARSSCTTAPGWSTAARLRARGLDAQGADRRTGQRSGLRPASSFTAGWATCARPRSSG